MYDCYVCKHRHIKKIIGCCLGCHFEREENETNRRI